jgi:hypothetical protein
MCVLHFLMFYLVKVFFFSIALSYMNLCYVTTGLFLSDWRKGNGWVWFLTIKLSRQIPWDPFINTTEHTTCCRGEAEEKNKQRRREESQGEKLKASTAPQSMDFWWAIMSISYPKNSVTQNLDYYFPCTFNRVENCNQAGSPIGCSIFGVV